jgi:anaerobic selenocysteine-containing dehydrogenase
VPEAPEGVPAARIREHGDVVRLSTIRSNDQFNTTIYGYNDRLRGVNGTRMAVFMNRNDIKRLGLEEGQIVDLETADGHDFTRQVKGFRIVAWDIAEGCASAYFPEASALVPLWHHEPKSFTPGYKALPVRVTPSE